MKISIASFLLATAMFIPALAFGQQSEPNLAPLKTVTVQGLQILANENGLTVYVFDKDTHGVSNCNGGCAKAWPPVLLPAGTSVSAPLGTVKRQDGSLQITFNGRPVYLYEDDTESGDTYGDGIGGIWHIVNVQ